MTGRASHDCKEVELSLGVFVLGALEPAERHAVEAHLAKCSRCTAILAELAPLPGLLHRLDPIAPAVPSEDSAPVQTLPLVPPELRERLFEAARADRARQRRRLVAASFAAAAVLVGVLLAGQFPGVPWGHDGASKTTVASATDAKTSVRADVRLMPDATGSELTLHLAGVAPEEHCSLVAINGDGLRDVAATWEATYAGEAAVVGHTSFRPDQIKQLVIVTEAGRTLVRVPIKT
jgi:predicted anti-sigma-YlaC factor YlaD